MQPNVRSRDPLRPESTNEIRWFKSNSNTNTLNQNVGKQKKCEKNNGNISVTRISSSANGARITFENYNEIMDVLLRSLFV